MKKITNILKLMRPKQWVKNGFVLGAVIFSGGVSNNQFLVDIMIAFMAFCLASSTVYALNDIVDIEKDKAHPKKCKRPLASGALSKLDASILSIVLAIASLVLAGTISTTVVAIIVLYFVNNILYSFKLKNIVLVDVFSIAFGFVLRVVAGFTAIQANPSGWILLSTLFISLFLGLGKRKGEIKLLQKDATSHRKILMDYKNTALDNLINMVMSGAVVFYSIYTIDGTDNPLMIATTIFVVYGVFRYTHLMEISTVSSSPTGVVLEDSHMRLTIALWIVSSLLITL